MRTAKCIAIVMIVSLAGLLTAAQESTPSASSQEPSGAQTAECLLVITADPGIIPLNMETIASLLYSPSVLGRAATEVLGSDAPPDPRGLVSIQWLSGEMRSSGRRGSRSSAEPGYDDMAAYEAAYERDYANIMHTTPEAGQRSSPPTGAPGSAPSTRPEQNEQRDPGRDTESPYGGMGGGYGGSVSGGVSGMAGGGMMGGGMGGMGMGGMGGGMGGMMGGGMMGGGMGGMGMGGMGGGMGGMMGGGMGMGGMGGFYGAPARPEGEQPAEQRATFKLTVRLPDNARPVAGQFMKVIATNLWVSLGNAHRQQIQRLDELLFEAKSHRDEAQKRLQGDDRAPSPGEVRIREQLDRIVDLSALTTQTPLAEAFELLKNSVQPPLPIVVQWNALDVTPADSAGIDGLPSMRLGTALDLLVKGPRGTADAQSQGDLARRMALLTKGLPRSTYRIQGDVIVVGPDSLARGPALSSMAPQGQVEIRALADQRNGLMRTIQGLEMELAGMEARRKAIQEQIVQGRELADRQLAEDAVTKELQTLLDLSKMNLDTIRKSADAGRVPTTDLTQAMESMTRVKIDLARRREELMKSAGGGQLEQYNAELSRIAIDKAERQAQLEVLHKQLGDVQRQLMQASTFDPEAARIRVAQETLDLANRRVAEIQARLVNLQPPSVAMIGAN